MIRRRIRIEGLVQGVGFRPFIYTLARLHGLCGMVYNDSRGVVVEVQGEPAVVQLFVNDVVCRLPPLASIEQMTAEDVPVQMKDVDFVIAPSASTSERSARVSPDVATCDDCLAELFNPHDRRFRYPFINCTACGPRFTIVQDIPYDRARTTMAGFPMCVDCRREFEDPMDRRFHAQPVACWQCGPGLSDAVEVVVRRLLRGEVVAIKGLGGYHLAAVASDEAAVAALRARKHREEKPFAIMVRDVDEAARLAFVDAMEGRLLTSPERPIVLLRRRPDADVAPSVAPGHPCLGLMLPYTPLHHLLVYEAATPLVLTSGNRSDEPIAYQDEDAKRRLHGIADHIVTHNRPIHIRTDDSVVRVADGAPLMLRRSRGYVPRPVSVPPGLRPVLACGAELKNTIALGRGRRVFVSHHIGDLENLESLRAFEEATGHFQSLFDIRPECIAYDLHPDYLSTRWALSQTEIECVGVQHHHAHIASCMADNSMQDVVIGVAFDGLGYGSDGTLWGGEFLLADYSTFQRVGHFASVPMPGGTAAIRQPWRMAAAFLEQAGVSDLESLGVRQRHLAHWGVILQMIRGRIQSPLTSSVGRLFDAVSSVLNVRDEVTYEGQAAILLEMLVDEPETSSWSIAIPSTLVVDGAALVRYAALDMAAGVSPAVIAARFHNTLAEAVREVCLRIRDAAGVSTVALSGGVFQNLRLLAGTTQRLESCGFKVLRHRQVPPNDGGLSLGQAVIAGSVG